MLVKEIMTSNVEWVGPDMTIDKLAIRMKDRDIGCLPVEEGNRLVGLVTDRDIAIRAIAAGLDPKTAMAREIMSKDVIYCFEDQDLDDAAHVMEEKRVRRLPVLSRFDKALVGMLALDDLSKAASHQLAGEVMEAVSIVHH